jgi:hypothetical protein
LKKSEFQICATLFFREKEVLLDVLVIFGEYGMDMDVVGLMC